VVIVQFLIVVHTTYIIFYTFLAQNTPNAVQSVDVVLYGLSFVIPLMNSELLKVSTLHIKIEPLSKSNAVYRGLHK